MTVSRILFVIICSTILGCQEVEQVKEVEQAQRPLAKFEPQEGEVLVFIGQDLESIGGLEGYNDGYCDYFPMPAGITLYTGAGANDGSFGGENKSGLNGVNETIITGNGPTNMSLIMHDEQFKDVGLAIGFSMVNNEDKVASGALDSNIIKLSDFIISLGETPVFLRIGYEFDGYPWNNYDREDYLKAYKRVVDIFRERNVENVAFVWQSVGFVSNWEQLDAWYPGDAYVDWCGYSFFNRYDEAIMIEYARAKGKPVFIAEASATISDFTAKFDGDTKETILSNPEQAQEAWDKWFVPFFETIENNTDVVKAIHYINCNWKVRPMWFENPTFRDVDARIQTSPMISKKWIEKMKNPLYKNASDKPFNNQTK